MITILSIIKICRLSNFWLQKTKVQRSTASIIKDKNKIETKNADTLLAM